MVPNEIILNFRSESSKMEYGKCGVLPVPLDRIFTYEFGDAFSGNEDRLGVTGALFETNSQGMTGAVFDYGNYGTPTNPLRWVMPQSEGQGNGSIRNCLFRDPVSYGKARPSQKNGGAANRAPIGRSRREFRGKARRTGTSRDYWCEFNYAYKLVVTGPTFKASA